MHTRCFLEKTANRYEELYSKSIEQHAIFRKGMRATYRKRAKQLRRKLSSGLHNAKQSGDVLKGIIAHEWYYLFHNFCKKFCELQKSLRVEEVKEILILRNVNYLPQFGNNLESCVRNFMETFVRKSQFYSKEFSRVTCAQPAIRYQSYLLKMVNYDIECLQVLMKYPTFQLEGIHLLQINSKDLSCELFREMMKCFKLPTYYNLSRFFNERPDLFEIAIEVVSNRTPRGVELLIRYSNYKTLPRIDNQELRDLIDKN